MLLIKRVKYLAAFILGGCALSAKMPAMNTQTSQAAVDTASSKQAQDVLNKMIATYRQMNSFSLKAGTYYGIGLGTEIDFQKPNKVAVTFYGQDGARHAICDGKYIYAFRDKDKMRYERKPVPPNQEAIAQTLLAANSPAIFTAAIFTASKWQDLSLKSLTMSKSADFMGTSVDVVNATPSTPGPPNTSGEITFQIGHDDHLLREVDFKINEQGETQMMNETHGNKCLTVNPVLPPVLFTFQPPPGAQQIASLDPIEPHYTSKVKAGDAPLPFTAVDTNSQPVNLAQYRGKVVLLDYWATWCAPCMREMPAVIALNKRYQKHGLEIVGVSLDQADARKNLAQFVRAQGMSWRQVCDGQGFDNPLVTAYGVKGIPFNIVIGRNGKIAAMDVHGKALEDAISRAIEAK